MVQSAKLAVTLVVLVLIQCTFVDGWLWRRRTSRRSRRRTPDRTSSTYRCRNRRSIYGMVEEDGSMINETKYEMGEKAEQDESKTKNEIEGQEKSKRGLAEAIPLIELGVNVLTKVLDTLGNIGRKIAIGIGNDTPFAWKADGVYFYSGTSDDILPACVSSKEAAIFPARKTSGPVATGAVGVLCYYIPDKKKSLCVLFSVPFNYNFYSNWWDVKVFSGKKSPNYQLYYDMYHGTPYKGDNRYHKKNLGYGFVLKDGYMTSSGNAKLMMKIKTK